MKYKYKKSLNLSLSQSRNPIGRINLIIFIAMIFISEIEEFSDVESDENMRLLYMDLRNHTLMLWHMNLNNYLTWEVVKAGIDVSLLSPFLLHFQYPYIHLSSLILHIRILKQ